MLQPSLKKKKSVSKLETKDTKSVSKYMLTHQDIGSDGEFQTKYYKVWEKGIDRLSLVSFQGQDTNW